MTLERYQLIDEDDEPLTGTFADPQEAIDLAHARGLAVEALIFEYVDSELIADYRRSDP